MLVGVVDRVDQLGDRARLDGAGGELEAQVDDLGVVVDREVDALGDRRRAAVALRVEHADRHQPHAVGQAGDADAVVGRLGDRARDLRAVAVAVLGVGAVRDEVVAPRRTRWRGSRASARTARGWRRRRRCRAPRRSRPPRRDGRPRARLAHAWGALTPNGPTKFHCSCSQPPGHAARPGVVGVERARGCGPARRGRCSRAPPRRPPGACAVRDRARHAHAAAQRSRWRTASAGVLGARDAGARERRVARRPRYARRESDDDDARLVRSGGRLLCDAPARRAGCDAPPSASTAERERREERAAGPAGERKSASTLNALRGGGAGREPRKPNGAPRQPAAVVGLLSWSDARTVLSARRALHAARAARGRARARARGRARRRGDRARRRGGGRSGTTSASSARTPPRTPSCWRSARRRARSAAGGCSTACSTSRSNRARCAPARSSSRASRA